MNLEDIIAALSANNQGAAGYLNDPNSNPAVGRTQRYPSGIPMPNATLGPDGMRLPLPRIQGTGAVNRMQKAPAYPMAFGPGAGATPPQPQQGRPQLQFPATAPVMRFRDATATVGPAMVDQPMQTVAAPWTQPAQIEAGPAVSENRLPIGAPPLQRGMEPPSAPQTPVDEDAEWNAAMARVRANMGRDPTTLRAAAERELGPLRDRARRSEQVASTPPRYWPRDISRGANFTRTQYGGRPIDLSRPRIDNADGSFSTERTITIEADGRHYNIPTIVGGRQRSEDEAIRLWEQGQNQEVGVFRSQSEAEAAARARSERIGQVRATR